ncbi:hypothetical protein GGI07_005211 [Coemansia sp. Benny D115]|nr:hypothetical protein GGI07_005211 [Coemansia sp. Benny D115]
MHPTASSSSNSGRPARHQQPGEDRTSAREKLRAFYKLTPPPSSQSPVARPANSALDLDSASFDSKKYLKTLLLSQQVPGLLQSSTTLITSLRQIDGDMKTMVYENYSKFISATQTIHHMKNDADYMDLEMAKLTQRINSISQQTKALDRQFDQRRARLQQLSREKETLGRLQLLFDLPERLSQLIGRGEFVEAASEWSRTRPLLEHYRQVGTIAGVESDGRQIMASVEQTVWARWRDEATGVREGAECASLLVLLRPELADKLWREYLVVQGAKIRKCRQQALDSAYGIREGAADANLGDAADSSGPMDQQSAMVRRIARFNEEYLPVWSSLVIGFASQFVSPAGSGLLDESPIPPSTAGRSGSGGGDRTMSLLEATTEGTIVGLLSPQTEKQLKQQQQQQHPSEPTMARRSSVSRHQRTLSGRSVNSQGSGTHQRSGSVLSATWSAAAINVGTAAATASQSPLPFHSGSVGSSSGRGLAHARAVSSAFEALGNAPAQPGAPISQSLSPALAPYGSQKRLSRASTANASSIRHQPSSHGPSSGNPASGGSRQDTLRRSRHQHTHSSSLQDLFTTDSPEESSPMHSLRRSLSLRRQSTARRYRPWLIGTVNRNAPLHVFLADMESWLIQQILERVNPLLETVVQHYLDIEASQILDEGTSGDQQRPSVAFISLPMATKLRQSFIRSLDKSLDAWMSDWMPKAFLHAAMVGYPCGSKTAVERLWAESEMTLMGVGTVGDPVSSLLLARFAVDFELTLTQSVYQLCEHAISIVPDDQVGSRSKNTAGGTGTNDSLDPLMFVGRPNAMDYNDPTAALASSGVPTTADRLYSMTAGGMRADSMASMVSNGRRATLGLRTSSQLLGSQKAEHAAKWHSVAEQLVRHFVMTVGQDISSDYLGFKPYGSPLNGGCLVVEGETFKNKISSNNGNSECLWYWWVGG